MLVLNDVGLLQQVKQNRTGNVVGQIAHHPQLRRLFRCEAQRLGQGHKIHFEDIGLDHVQLGMFTQLTRQIAVQLNHGQVAQALDQGLGQGGQTRTDFHHDLLRLGRYCSNNFINHTSIGQEMLPKPFASAVLHGASRNST